MNNDRIKKVLEFVNGAELDDLLFFMDIIESDDSKKELILDVLRIKEKEQKWILEIIEKKTEEKTLEKNFNKEVNVFINKTYEVRKRK